MNKKGLQVLEIIPTIFYMFIIVLFIGIVVLIFYYINFGLDRDIDVGQVNLKDVNADTFGKINTSLSNNADIIGIILLFGMCIVMIINAYYNGEENPKLMLIIDIFLSIFVFIIAVYVSRAYNDFITANTGGVLDLYKNTLPNTSKFILNLPLISSIVSIIIMIVSYSGFKKDYGEINVMGI